MAQINWVFLDSQGGRHKIGLYHGDRSGHLLIHCNLQVIQIDFSVKDSKSYSFFIDNEFIEVRIIKENGQFFYEFFVDKKIDTPLNRARKIQNTQNNKKLAWVISGILIVLSLSVWGLWSFGWQQEAKRKAEAGWNPILPPEYERRLRLEGKVAAAKLYLQQDSVSRKVFYTFKTAEGTPVTGGFELPGIGQIYLPNGWPLSDQDEFEVRYWPGDARVHRLDYEHPTPYTIEGYLRLAVAAEIKAHPGSSPKHALCVAGTILDARGWRELGHVIFQAADPDDRPAYNRNTYQRLIREVQMAQLLDKACWDR
jgi:hypothetical protein